MDVVLETAVVSNAGSRVRSLAQDVPEPLSALHHSSGSATVDDSVAEFLASLGRCLQDAATAVHGLGEGAVSAADAFAQTDRSLTSEGR